jgi:hypothetical protein
MAMECYLNLRLCQHPRIATTFDRKANILRHMQSLENTEMCVRVVPHIGLLVVNDRLPYVQDDDLCTPMSLHTLFCDVCW